jgi:hypothetical protein
MQRSQVSPDSAIKVRSNADDSSTKVGDPSYGV